MLTGVQGWFENTKSKALSFDHLIYYIAAGIQNLDILEIDSQFCASGVYIFNNNSA